jgi:hypothetical protein
MDSSGFVQFRLHLTNTVNDLNTGNKTASCWPGQVAEALENATGLSTTPVIINFKNNGFCAVT